jgi:Rrf2 family protein
MQAFPFSNGMKFSTKSTYGLRAMINLAKNWQKGSVSLANIAKEEDISQGYLERLFSSLKKAKLVKSVKGAAGGYKLSGDPKNINVLDIINALEGKTPPFYCVDNDNKVYCSASCECAVSSVLSKVQNAVNSTLKDIKLRDLIHVTRNM